MLTAIAADRLRRRPVPRHGALGRDGHVGAAGLVGGDEVRQHELEGGVVEAVHVNLGAGIDLRGRRRVHVAGFPVVIPWEPERFVR